MAEFVYRKRDIALFAGVTAVESPYLLVRKIRKHHHDKMTREQNNLKTAYAAGMLNLYKPAPEYSPAVEFKQTRRYHHFKR